MNQTATLDIRQAFKDGWEGTKKNFLFLVGLMLITIIVPMIPGILGSVGSGATEVISMGSGASEEGMFSFVMSLISWLIQIILGMGSVKIALTILAGQKPTYALLIPDGKKVGPFIVASLYQLNLISSPPPPVQSNQTLLVPGRAFLRPLNTDSA